MILTSRALTHLQKRYLLQPNLRPGNDLHGWFLIIPTSGSSSFTLLEPPPAFPSHQAISQYFWEKLPKDKELGSPHLSDNTQSSGIYGRNRRGGGDKKPLWKSSLLLQLIKYTSISATLPLSIQLPTVTSLADRNARSWEMAWVQITLRSQKHTPAEAMQTL